MQEQAHGRVSMEGKESNSSLAITSQLVRVGSRSRAYYQWTGGKQTGSTASRELCSGTVEINQRLSMSGKIELFVMFVITVPKQKSLEGSTLLLDC